MDDILCQICEKPTAGDERTLRLQYLYDLTEASLKFRKWVVEVTQATGRADWPSIFFTLTTCKDCRGDFIGLLRKWANGELIEKPEPEATIPVRVDGRNKMLTRMKWDTLHALTSIPDSRAE